MRMLWGTPGMLLDTFRMLWTNPFAHHFSWLRLASRRPSSKSEKVRLRDPSRDPAPFIDQPSEGIHIYIERDK